MTVKKETLPVIRQHFVFCILLAAGLAFGSVHLATAAEVGTQNEAGISRKGKALEGQVLADYPKQDHSAQFRYLPTRNMETALNQSAWSPHMAGPGGVPLVNSYVGADGWQHVKSIVFQGVTITKGDKADLDGLIQELGRRTDRGSLKLLKKVVRGDVHLSSTSRMVATQGLMNRFNMTGNKEALQAAMDAAYDSKNSEEFRNAARVIITRSLKDNHSPKALEALLKLSTEEQHDVAPAMDSAIRDYAKDIVEEHPLFDEELSRLGMLGKVGENAGKLVRRAVPVIVLAAMIEMMRNGQASAATRFAPAKTDGSIKAKLGFGSGWMASAPKTTSQNSAD